MNVHLARTGLFAILSCWCLVATAQQETIDWTYLEVLYTDGDIDSTTTPNPETSGPRIAGSIGFGDHLHAQAYWETLSLDDVDDGNGGVIQFSDVDIGSIGIGIHSSPFRNISGTDLASRTRTPTVFNSFLNVNYLRLDGGSSDRNGYSVVAGLRATNYTRLEVLAAAGYKKFESLDGGLTLEARILYRIVGDFQLQAGWDWSDQDSRGLFGLRYSF